MKTGIYYFSGTGNSLAVAKELRSSMKNSCIVPIKGFLKEGKMELREEQIGIVAPVYYMALPEMVETFLYRAYFSHVKYIFFWLPGAAPYLEQHWVGPNPSLKIEGFH